MLTWRTCLWTNHPSCGSQAQEVGELWERCVGKEVHSSRDWEKQWVPGSHSHTNKKGAGTTAVDLDAVNKCA